MSLLQMSGSAAIMILIVIIMREMTKHKLSHNVFLCLWGMIVIRLLIPFSIPFKFSAYSALTQVEDRSHNNVQISGIASLLPINQEVINENLDSIQVDQVQKGAVSLFSVSNIVFLIWLAGFLFGLCYFGYHYIRCRRVFAVSLPLDDTFVIQWMGNTNLKRKLQVRVSDQIIIPLTYGIFHPVILLPKYCNIKSEYQLLQVLTHELEHIKAFDEFKKLIFIFVRCLHWFNPFVWIMTILADRDIEMACDERVVLYFKEQNKSDYALTLIELAEQGNSPMSIYNHFSKYAIKERVQVIMKFKRTSVAAIIMAGIFLAGLFSIFSTSAYNEETLVSGREAVIEKLPSDLEEKYKPLQVLKLDGYKKMTIHEFRNKAHEIMDQNFELLLLMDDLESLLDYRYNNETASFLLNILSPLTAERWEQRDLGNIAYAKNGDQTQGFLEYVMTYQILDADTLTVKEYQDAIFGLMSGIQDYMKRLPEEDLSNQNVRKTELALLNQIQKLTEIYSNDNIILSVDSSYGYMPYYEEQEAELSDIIDSEEGIIGPASEEDYQTFLALKNGYEEMTVEQQRELLWDLSNEESEETLDIVWARVMWDLESPSISLGEEDRKFLSISIAASLAANVEENRARWNDNYQAPSLSFMNNMRLDSEQYGGQDFEVFYACFDFGIDFTIHDESVLLVIERDEILGHVVQGILDFYMQMDESILVEKGETLLLEELERLIQQHNNGLITMAVKNLHLDVMDEREDYKNMISDITQ